MADEGLELRTTNRFPVSGGMTESPSLLRGACGPRLERAIDTLYRAFKHARIVEPLRYCRHCFTQADADYLRLTPLHDLPFRDVAFLLPKLITTLGTGEDVNYFLPRILEAFAHQAHYLKVALPSKLRHGRAAGWSDVQLAAVVEFFSAYVDAANKMLYNATLTYALDDMLPELKTVIPELPPQLRASLNDPSASI